MAVIRRETIGYGSKLKNSLVGFLLSFVFLFGSLALLAWNENRTLKTAQGLEAAGKLVQNITADAVDPALEGQLVHLSAEVETVEGVADSVFGLAVPGLVLRRKVEVYQWEEKQTTREQEKLGGGTERVTEYSYQKTWHEGLIDSDRFEDSSHRNPDSIPFESERVEASDAYLGAFYADSTILGALDEQALNQPELANLSFPEGFRAIDGATFYRGRNPESPEIGDMRVRFYWTPPQMVSLIAQQQGEGFVDWTSPADTSIYLARAGQHDAAAMVATAQSENTLLGWLIRGGGFALMWLAFGLMLAPLKTAASVLPPLGRAIGAATGIASLLLAATLSTLTIVLSWILVRPLWAAGVALLIAVGIGLWARKGARNANAAGISSAPPAAPMGPPPPPPR